MKKSILLLISLLILFAGCTSQSEENVGGNGDMDSSDQQNVEEVSYDRTINLSSFNFGYSKENITISSDETVRIILENEEGTHDFVIDELDVQSSVISGEGETTEIIVEGSQIGEFEFYCSIGNHRERGMFGTLIVEE